MERVNEQKIIPIDIEDEMKKSYIDYAMSVIVGRALPDVRDGLKPVHRRILYAMSELGLAPNKPFRKSARIVGDVLGKYHPHGDTAVYDSMVRMAQDFSTRYLLVEGHGNFGSVDGDSAAAMRYTEARMAKLSVELLKDINKETVDFIPNFDGTLQEPAVLPSRFPNLLVNGSSGIAVGMATNIPPHNLGEVIDGVIKVIENPDIRLEELMKKIKGPDFPTGGLILGTGGIKDAYSTGRGKIKLRAQAKIEQLSSNRSRIVITEIPYQVNKAKLIEKIAELVKEKRVENISDIRDESDRKGMRIVIELKRDGNPNIVLNYLYKHTQMQVTFGVIMLALVDGEPRVCNLKQLIYHYIDHQKEVITRRTRYDLNKAEARAHILEGLKVALDNLDQVIKLIRSSKTVEIARNGLMADFGLTQTQAQAILDMRLQRLTGLEREKIEQEYSELLKTIDYLKKILSDEDMLYGIIKEELMEIKDKYSDDRRTAITFDSDEIDVEDLIEDEDVVITLTHFGYIKRVLADVYKNQRRGGKGIIGLNTREDDFVESIFTTSTHHNILFFTNKGKMYRLKAYEIPEAGRTARGTAIINLIQLEKGENITAVIPIKDFTEGYNLVMATRYGQIKKTSLIEYDTNRKSGLAAINLKDDDELIGVRLTDGEQEIVIGTREGFAIRFKEEEVRNTGRASQGVKAIDLRKDDYVIGMDLISEGSTILTVSENGFGKKTSIEEYRLQLRGGKGIINYNVTRKTGKPIAIKVISEQHEIMMISSDGTIIRMRASEISKFGRNTQGVKLMKLDDDNKVVCATKVLENEEN
ncbi:MAG: DNA gyrase subunit A [Clostridia bacterium]|nr:DNA gyrase subunit A [Clostridia bacterium]